MTWFLGIFSSLGSNGIIAAAVALVGGGVLLLVRRSGKKEQQINDLRKEVADAAIRAKVDADVSRESDAAVADDLRKQRPK